ncbi:hypothetical protein NHQ30_007615 [Ciborinia camelliae]|nr:hypothetical protein NHQ30_007615 [Ciborinia camelliae]
MSENVKLPEIGQPEFFIALTGGGEGENSASSIPREGDDMVLVVLAVGMLNKDGEEALIPIREEMGNDHIDWTGFESGCMSVLHSQIRAC